MTCGIIVTVTSHGRRGVWELNCCISSSFRRALQKTSKPGFIGDQWWLPSRHKNVASVSTRWRHRDASFICWLWYDLRITTVVCDYRMLVLYTSDVACCITRNNSKVSKPYFTRNGIFCQYPPKLTPAIIHVTTRLDNARTSTPGGYATTSDTRPCLWLNSVLWEFFLWDKDTVSSIQFDCENIPKSQTLSVPEISFSSSVKLACDALHLTENSQWNKT